MTTKQISSIVSETIKEYESKKNDTKKISFWNSVLIALIPIFIVSALGSYTGIKILDAVQDYRIQSNHDAIIEVRETSNTNYNEIFKINGRVSHMEGKLGISGTRGTEIKNSK